MLAPFYRLHGVNESGQTMTFDSGALIAIRLQPWAIRAGVLSFTTSVITDDLQFSSGETIVDNAAVEGVVHDNSSNLDFGVKGKISIAHDVDAAVGVFRLYIEESDSNANWISDETDFDPAVNARQICVVTIDPSAADASVGKNFEF